jgi:VCBS repeat-containing protein
MAEFKGTSGNDTLAGTTAADRLVGRAGNDTYIVNHVDDEVAERRNEGTDLVLSSVNYRLASNVEALMLVGSAALSGTGNTLNNVLIGNDAANRLDGGSGADFMAGGGGDDVYVVDNTADNAMEGSEQGTDSVESSVSYTLGGNVENLGLTGSSAINATGNGLDNVIIGNAAANSLSGGGGDDTLIGLGGNDTLIGGGGFDTAVYSGSLFDYAVTKVGANFRVTDLRPGGLEGIDTAISIEALRCSDFTVSLNSNNAPMPFDDAVSTTEDTPLVISVGSLLSNDRDFEGSTLSVVAVSNGAHGTAVLNSNGTITYTPDAYYNGADNFTYTVSDGTLESIGTVNVAVAGIDSAPVARADSALGSEDTPIVTGTVLANDSDAETILTPASIVEFRQGANGTVVYNNDGTFTYTPHLNYNGADSFTYTISDGALTSTATVNVTMNAVNDAPIAANDEASGDEDTAITTANVLDNDSDVDDTLTPASISAFTHGAHGTAVHNGDGTFTYTPNPNYSGSDSFTYTISDGALTSTATVDVTVDAMNDAPVAANDSASGSEDTAIVTGNVLANDSDAETVLTPASIVGLGHGAHGSVAYNGGGTFTYTPSLNYHGSDSFTYTISDGTLTSTASVNVMVEAVNDSPLTANDEASGAEDTPITTANVLDNDSDVDSALTAASISAFTQGAQGTVAHNGDGAFTYTPNLNYSGSDSFTYTISDGALTSTATVNVTIDAENDAPVAANDSASGDEDTPITSGNVLANDFDVDDTLSAASVSGFTHGANGAVAYNDDGTFTYVPDANFEGADSFTYTVSDGAGGRATATVNVTVAAVNDAAVISGDTSGSVMEDVLAVAGGDLDSMDVDGIDDAWQPVTSPAASVNGYATFTIDPTGHWSYLLDDVHPAVQALDDGGTLSDSFLVATADGTQQIVSITIHGTHDNEPPVAIPDANSGDAVVEAATVIASGFASVNLDDVASGNRGFKIIAENGGDAVGYTLAGLPDLNGDGHGDLLIGAFQHDGNGADSGAAYVVFGNGGGSQVDLGHVAAGMGGFKITGENAHDRLAGGHQAVSVLGDVNNDTVADFLIGAYWNDRDAAATSDSGAAYVVFGKTSGTPVDLASVAAGTGGYKIIGEAAQDQVGFSVSAAGDVNGDGRADMVIGTLNGTAGDDGRVTAYVVLGKNGTATVDLDDVAQGIGGFKIFDGIVADMSGRAVTGLGDMNGDGRSELLIGAPADAETGANAGAAYVVFGKTDTEAVSLHDIAAGHGGFKIVGAHPGEVAGWSLAGVGDVNADGRADMLLGAWGAGATGNGAAYVVFGKSNGATVNLADVAVGNGGFKIIGESKSFQGTGFDVSAIGDVNGDGIPELLVGALFDDAGGEDSGAAYVVFGKSGGAAVHLDAVAAGIGGFKIFGESATDGVGVGLSGVSDVNRDGIPDVLLGAYRRDGFSGAAYVVFSPSANDPGDPIASGNVLTNDTDDSGVTSTVVGVQADSIAGPLSGGVGTTIDGTYGKLMLSADGAYTYTLDNDDPQTKALVDGQTAQDIFSYTIADASGATASSTLTISISGRDDDPPALATSEVLGGGADATIVGLDADLGTQTSGPNALTDDLLQAGGSSAIV